MSIRLNQQLSFRWLPEAPSDALDVLVMNVSDWFIDLRILKVNGSLDWGFAGQEIVLKKEPGDHVLYQWTHLIDSKGYTSPDVGSLPSSIERDFVETGEAINPDTNVLTHFEECWRPLPIPFIDTFPYAWILQSEDGKTFLGQIGGVYQAIRDNHQEGSESRAFCARRELWDNVKKSWTTKHSAETCVHGSCLPSFCKRSLFIGVDWPSVHVGDLIEVSDDKYVVLALSTSK